MVCVLLLVFEHIVELIFQACGSICESDAPVSETFELKSNVKALEGQKVAETWEEPEVKDAEGSEMSEAEASEESEAEGLKVPEVKDAEDGKPQYIYMYMY